MNETRHCPECQTPLSGDALEGLCPTCLFDRALEPNGREEAGATTPSRFVPPKPGELAEHFPQLDILDLIGHGGMGAVYKARQIALDRFVALKIIHSETAQDPSFARRFSREARALAQLNHPGIVGIHDFGRAGGMFYLIMEFVDGVNLRQLIADGQIQPDEALSIIPQICEALEYAHTQGVLHRDIKPENILMSKQGRVKIADFGLAKLVGSASVPGDNLTGTQQVMGTPNYMSPEQMERPQEVDHRSDIYSLGVVLYEMLTGELPLGRFEPPSSKIQIDVRLDEVVLRSLQKQPDRRYQHASEFKTDVEAISTGTPLTRADTWSLRLADVGGLTVVIAVFALVGFGMAFTGSADSMWGLIVLWWFTSGFHWSPTGKTLAGLMGVFLALLAIGMAIWVTGSLMPLWALLGVFWFASEFGWTESKDQSKPEDEDDLMNFDGEYQGPIVGLSRRELRILRQLKKFDPTSDDIFFVLPDIPQRRLKNAREVCAVPPGERILGLFDLTFWGTARKSLVFGRDGIYFYCGANAHPDGPQSIPYDVFAKLSIANAGDRVNLDEQRFLVARPCSAWYEKITNALIAISEIV